MRKQSIIMVLFFSSLILINILGCTKGSESYYPLKEGITWDYQFNIHTHNKLLIFQGADKIDKTENKKLIITNLLKREMTGKMVTPRKCNFNGRVVFHFISEDDKGLHRLAVQTPESVEPKIITPLEYIIKYPIKEGTTWETNFNPSWDNKINIKINNTIEKINETITVSDGTFNNCLKIKGLGTAKDTFKDPLSFGRNKLIPVNINLESFDWYAPGVGLIKGIFRESVSGEEGKKELIYSRSITVQLESFKQH